VCVCPWLFSAITWPDQILDQALEQAAQEGGELSIPGGFKKKEIDVVLRGMVYWVWW